MHDNSMTDPMSTFIKKVTMDFKNLNTHVNGLLIVDKNGLKIASQDVTNDSSGPIAMISDLASTLLDRTATVCLENGDQKIIIREAGKTVFSIYNETNRR